MLEYRLDDLGWEGFERLCQALLKAKLGVGVESWGGTGDWGNDAYCQAALRYPGEVLQPGPFQFQVKFVQGANAAGAKPKAGLLSAVHRECERITARNQAAPAVYSLLTNVVLSPQLRTAVEQAVRDALPDCTHVVVHGGNDICSWLHLHSDVVRMFPQLLSHRDLAELVRKATNTEADTTVNKLAEPKRAIPENVRATVREGTDHFNAGRFAEAETAYSEALRLAEASDHPIAVVQAKEHLALVLLHYRHDPERAKALLNECLAMLSVHDDEEERADVLDRLANAYEEEGDSDRSESLQRQSVAIYARRGDVVEHAGALVKLAWIVGRRGKTTEAFQLNAQAYDILLQYVHSGRTDERLVPFAHAVLANLLFQRAKIYQRYGDPAEAERAMAAALEWQRKEAKNHELAKLLQELARLRMFRRDVAGAVDLLGEAADILQELELFSELSDCLSLLGRVFASEDKKTDAAAFFSMALQAAIRGTDSRKTTEPLENLAQLARESGDTQTAQKYLSTALDSLPRDEDRASILVEIARTAKKGGDLDEWKRRLHEAIEVMKAVAARSEGELQRARHLFTLAHYLRFADRVDEALTYAMRAKDIFKASDDVRSYAEAWFEVAGLLDHLGRKDEAREAVKAVRTYVEGKPFEDIVAAAELALAKFAMADKSLDDAKRRVEDVIERCKKHGLPWLPDALHLLDEIETIRKHRAPSNTTLPALIDELHQQRILCPVNKEGYLRLWAFCRAPAISASLRSVLTPNVAVITSELQQLSEVSRALKPYRTWSLIVPPEIYPEDIQEIVPFSDSMFVFADGIDFIFFKKTGEGGEDRSNLPVDEFMKRVHVPRDLGARFAVAPYALGGAVGRYMFVSTEKDAEKYGGATSGAFGDSLALPPVVHELLEERTAAELKSERLFFAYYNRGRLEPQRWLSFDLMGLHSLRCMPVYLHELPESENVQILATSELKLPILTDTEAQEAGRALLPIRKALLNVLNADERAAPGALSELVAAADDLTATFEASESLHARCYSLKYQTGDEFGVSAALVIESANSTT
ncbi:MAG: hypothetical protein ABI779_18650 [Acidobacteriota bacterium]